MVATFVKRMTSNFSQVAEMFRCESGGPLPEYVVVSAINNMWGCETYIFPCDSEGTITDWLELEGSFKGEMDIDKALSDAGYEVKRGE